MLDLDDLKRRAEAASKGPWEWTNGALVAPAERREFDDATGDYDDGRVIWDPNVFHSLRGDADKVFIAAANPQAVLALISEIEQLREAVASHQEYDRARVAGNSAVHNR